MMPRPLAHIAWRIFIRPVTDAEMTVYWFAMGRRAPLSLWFRERA